MNKKWVVFALILLLSLSVVPFSGTPAPVGAEPADWLSGWEKRVKITLDHDDIDAALEDFPVLIYLSISSGRDPDDVTFVFDELQNDANRKKIAITKSDGTTECYVEIEKWDDGNEQAWLQTKISDVDSDVDTDIYLYYDSTHADNDAYVGDPSDAVVHNVWDDNFVFVSHMKDDPDTSHIRDSTQYNNDGTKGAANNPAVTTSGEINDAQDFDGNDFVQVTDSAELRLTSVGTVEAWIYPDSLAGLHQMIAAKGSVDTWDKTYCLFIYKDDVRMYISTAGSYSDTASKADVLTTSWQYVVGWFDGSNVKVSRNADVAASVVQSVTIGDSTGKNLFLGREDEVYPYAGLMDEVRISNINRSDAWIKASYESGRDHLNDFGSEETLISPVNDACDSTAEFIEEDYGWVNVTVFDPQGVDNLDTVRIQVNTTGDAETFTLIWSQVTGLFFEFDDDDNICTVDYLCTRVNIDANTDQICFYFKLTGGTVGLCDVKATSIDDGAHQDVDMFSNEFEYLGFVHPANDACDSTAEFIEDIYGWVNVTVSDPQGIADLATVDIQVNTTGDAETFVLRWSQASGLFNEFGDEDNICTVDFNMCTRINIDANTDQICFCFKLSGGTAGLCDVKAISIDNEAHQDIDMFSNEFEYLGVTYPVNDACDSTAEFIEEDYGWVNVTVSDPQLVANLATVDIQVNTSGDAETFTLRWTQSSGNFSEVSDADNICTLDADTSTRVNIDADTDQICFYFKILGGTMGLCDVEATSIDDEANQDVDMFSNEFEYLGVGYPVNVACVSTSPFIEEYYGWVNITVSDPQGVANLASVRIQVNTTGDAETFLLKWMQTFSEVVDEDNICTLDAGTSTRVNIDADTDRICFYFKITGGTLGYFDVKATSIDEEEHRDIDLFSNEFYYRLSWIASLDITNLAVDDWVFEGRTRYEFQIDYYSETLESIDQFGIRFVDSINQIHTIWYDQDANTLTVTSFEDGISGWLHSLTQAGTNATAIFHIMFNTPISDTYDVQVEIRVSADDVDSGWITPSGDTFNIYNLGGLSTLTFSGMAGRIPGGDVFEMYASGIRIMHLLPLENFDVRESPTPPGVQVLGFQLVPAGDEHSLLDELVNWKTWMTERTETRSILPTNRLPDTGEEGDVTYVSFPFGLLIKSDTTLSTSLVAEKEFFRTIETADDEIVTVEFWATVSNDTDVTGQIIISDDGYVDDLIKNVTTDTLRIVDFKFYGNGSIRLMDGESSIYPATYSGMAWANYTFVINLTAQTYDFYVNEVLDASAVDFCETVSSIGHISFLDTLTTLDPVEAVEFYVDDLVVTTDVYFEAGGIAESTMLFNQLQHWSMDFDFYVERGRTYAQGPTATPRTSGDDYSNYGYIELGWDVLLGGTWINDYLVARINITDGHISGKNDWVQFNISWYQQGEYVKHNLLYGLFEGYSLFPGDSKDTSGFHWDLWFNRANASTVVGARINTEYFGMSDKSPWWAVWGSRWTPMRTEVSESTVFIDLKDEHGTIHSVKDVGLVRSRVTVQRIPYGGFAYNVMNLANLDFVVAATTMSGIDAPPIRGTMVPDVPSGFLGSFLGAIFTSALKRLSNTLAGFGLAFFTLSVAFVDIIFAALGYPGLVSTIFTWMASLFANVPTLVGYGLTMVEQIFRLITVSASDSLGQLTGIITIWINMYGVATDFLSGVFTPGINLWNDLGGNSFIQIGAVLYPLWLLILGTDKGIQAVIDHISGVLNIGSFFLNFILNVAEFFIGLLRGLIGAIRG